MKKLVVSVMSFVSIGLSAGESIGLIENLKGSTRKYSFIRGVPSQEAEVWTRALASAGAYIQEYEPKLSSKFMDLQIASNTLLNTIKIIHRSFIMPFKNNIEDPFEIVDIKEANKIVNNIEKAIQPLFGELKKIKGLSSGMPFFKSEPQKVFNATKDILVKRIQETLDGFKEFKKNPIIN